MDVTNYNYQTSIPTMSTESAYNFHYFFFNLENSAAIQIKQENLYFLIYLILFLFFFGGGGGGGGCRVI